MRALVGLPGVDALKTVTPALLVWMMPLLGAAGCEAFVDADAIPRPACRADADCDDGVFCNGPERCDPADPTSDGFGCASPDPAAFIDDGIDCTVDRCDEAAAAITHNPSGCACTDDAQCAALANSPCLAEATCDPSDFTCRLTFKEAGEPCDDGVACTAADTCDADRACVGQPADADCDDGAFCNGPERCDPANLAADPLTGCAAGIAAILDPAQDDGIACTAPACDEGRRAVDHVPTGACACLSPEDCRDGSCQAFACDASTGFACAPIDGELLPAESACDDGASCTEGDRCRGDGACVGEPVQALCDDGDLCNGLERCDPRSPDADALGCLDGEPPPEPCP